MARPGPAARRPARRRSCPPPPPPIREDATPAPPRPSRPARRLRTVTAVAVGNTQRRRRPRRVLLVTSAAASTSSSRVRERIDRRDPSRRGRHGYPRHRSVACPRRRRPRSDTPRAAHRPQPRHGESLYPAAASRRARGVAEVQPDRPAHRIARSSATTTRPWPRRQRRPLRRLASAGRSPDHPGPWPHRRVARATRRVARRRAPPSLTASPSAARRCGSGVSEERHHRSRHGRLVERPTRFCPGGGRPRSCHRRRVDLGHGVRRHVDDRHAADRSPRGSPPCSPSAPPAPIAADGITRSTRSRASSRAAAYTRPSSASRPRLRREEAL